MQQFAAGREAGKKRRTARRGDPRSGQRIETQDAVDHWKDNHFWDQADTAAKNKKFEYTTNVTK